MPDERFEAWVARRLYRECNACGFANTVDLEGEIFIYDTLPGGAGFASQLIDRGPELFERGLRLMKTCPCDASCYRCLRSFKNKFEHSLLDRHVGAELLEYLLTGELPDFDAKGK